MQKILFCGALLCLVSAVACAQGLSLRVNRLSMNSLSAAPNIPGLTASSDFKANIFSVDLIGSFAAFQKKPGNLLRVGVGYSSFSLKGKSNTDYGDGSYDKGTGSLKQSNIRIAPGVSTGLAGSERFSLYAGADLPISVIGGTNFESEFEYFYDSLDNQKFRVEGNMSGGFSLGLSPFLGFSYMGLGPFSIGTEMATGLQYSMIGPDSEIKYYQDGVFQDTETTEVSISSFSKMPVRVSLVLTYRFMKPATE